VEERDLMKIVDVAHRDIYVTVEFSLEQILMLRALMDKAEITYEAQDKFLSEAVKYLHEGFEPTLKFLAEKFGGESDGRNSEGSES